MDRVDRVIAVGVAFVVLYLGVLVVNGPTTTPEAFPFFSWSLFSEIPDPVQTDYTIRFTEVDGRALDPPVDLEDARDFLPTSGRAATYLTVQALGRASAGGPAPPHRQGAEALEANHLAALDSAQYQVVERRFDILERDRCDCVLDEVVLDRADPRIVTVTDLIRTHLWSAPPAAGPAEADRVHARSILLVRVFYAVGVLLDGPRDRALGRPARHHGLRTQGPGGLGGAARHPHRHHPRRRGLRGGVGPGRRRAAGGSPASRTGRPARVHGGGQRLRQGQPRHARVVLGERRPVLLPGARTAWSAEATERQRRAYRHVIVLAQGVLLFFYTLTGLWKLDEAVGALVGPGVSAFQVDGFSYLVADNLLQTGRTTLLGDLLVAHPLLGWALFNGTMYLEATSLIVLFRPRLHRAWGIGLILFHLGTNAAMGIFFAANVVLLGLLLLGSPTAPDRVDLKATILDLPGIHLLARLRARARGRTTRGRRSPLRTPPGPHLPATEREQDRGPPIAPCAPTCRSFPLCREGCTGGAWRTGRRRGGVRACRPAPRPGVRRCGSVGPALRHRRRRRRPGAGREDAVLRDRAPTRCSQRVLAGGTLTLSTEPATSVDARSTTWSS